ncbi:MAG: flavodoxin family protein [Coriobacteriia bacterium]|nr:flavodoxin family protein [Coriobacteriia bacterium]
MAKNILVVHGSPRSGGNSAQLADAFMEGAKGAGHEVKLIEVGHAKIAGCQACEYCFGHEGECVQKDQMQDFYPELRWADVLVFAIPMYYYSYPAQIKAFQDRMFCGIAKPFGIKEVALLLTYEDKDPSTAQPLIDSFNVCANYCKQEVLGVVAVGSVYEKGAIAGNPGLEEARLLGASIE